MLFLNGFAQTRKKTNTPKKKVEKPTTSKITNTQTVDSNLNVVMADTAVKPIQPPKKDPFAFDSIRISLRPDAAVDRNLVKSRTPLVYEHIREDDAWYRERVWREIDIREKMNLSFRYKADDDNGNQRFLNILLTSIKKGDVTVFDPTVDDRFTTPMTIQRVGEVISGKCDSVSVIDWEKDPTGSKILWSLPKGHIEEGETPEQAAIREVAEETGINSDITQSLGVIDFWFMAGGKRIHKTVHHFVFKETGGLLAPQESEVDEVGWFPLGEIVALLAYPDEKKLIAKNSELLT
jgi:ADP-ribose pyrophosphatase YjhB (NUDIX family)